MDVPFFRLLGGAVGLLLMLACANVAALFLLRAAARRQELAARLALGAPRHVLARQLLIEGGLVAGAACVLGGIGAHLFVNRSAVLNAQFGPIAFGVDGRVLAFAGGAATLTTLLVAVLPILRVGRVAPLAALRSATAGGLRGVSGVQRALVVFQVAVSLTLVATASMIFGSLHRLLAEDPGFDAEHVVLVYFDPRELGWDAERTRRVVRDLPMAAERHPEIASASVGTMVPLLGRHSTVSVYRDGETPDAGSNPGTVLARLAAAGPGYFEVLGIPLLSGRGFDPRDGSEGAPVAVVSARLARTLWSDEHATGRHLEIARPDEPPLRLQVVGVAAGHKHTSLAEDDPLLLYVPIAGSSPDGTLLIARGRVGVPSREVLTGVVAEVDPEIFPDAIWTMEGLMNGSVSMDRRVSKWIGVFGVLALFLAALGVYGVVAHVARERLRELAVRSALGASPRQLVGRLMGMGVRLSLLGGLAGAVLLYWTQPVVRRSLEGVSGVDLPIVGACAGVLLLTMAVASFVPARRAARIAPVEVLREE
jgi:putative ABC transport system permease protein